jgi:uncharacterized protein (TIGR02145 family)
LIHFITQAQSPQGIPYQSVIRNGSGNLLINQSVQVRFTIHDSTMSGNIIYQETHASNTSAAAMLILTIGQGTPVIGNFSTINWGNGAKFMQVELDAAGGSNYTDLGTQQMMSVPYALYAKTAGSISLPPGASQGQVLTYCDGNYIWTNGGICPGSIASLNCSYSNNTGTLIANSQANNVSSIISYNGGNGGTYATQSVSSIGVTGLTATLAAGTLANGSGTITYSITGTPNGAGTASFQLNIGVQGCILNWIVDSQPAYPAGSIFCNGSPTLLVDVTNPATGKIWMDRNLGATQVAISSTDANAYGDLYQWGRGSDGHQCRNSQSISASTPMNTNLSSTDQPGHGYFIITGSYTSDWREPQNNNLWQGVNGINNPCPSGYRIPTDAELDAERLSWSSNDINAAFASPLKFTVAGYRIRSSGTVISNGNGAYWSSSISSWYARFLQIDANSTLVNFYRANGHSVRCIKEATAPVGTINTLDCNGATNSGTLTSGILATGVNSSISYSGGNGGIYPAQTIASTGVTGLTATIAAGIFANGNGTLTYTISGTPNSSGNASFVLNIGGQSCTLNDTILPPAQPAYPAGSVFCNGTPTLVVDVTNPATGKIWMDRNLGATQAATSSTDTASYGDLYQWGRGSDGHQCRNSPTTTTLSSSDQPGHGNFILEPTFSPGDWRSPQNINLWQGVNGVNNPCPSGYRLPTITELDAERTSWNTNDVAGAFTSLLKLPSAGARASFLNGFLSDVGTYGIYWSSTVSSANSRQMEFNSSIGYISNAFRAFGMSVRCIKN